ncbi:MAG: hypothetical protein SGPRY_012435, partial [Prymnesium sp.]
MDVGWEELRRLLVCPRVRDMSCCRRQIEAAGRASRRLEWGEMLSAMTTHPLKPVFSRFVIESTEGTGADIVSPPEKSLHDIFDVSSHPQAKSRVAKQMLMRLEDDVRAYYDEFKKHGQSAVVLGGFQLGELRECVKEAKAGRKGIGLLYTRLSRLDGLVESVGKLITSLGELRADDERCMHLGLSEISDSAHPVHSSSRADLLSLLRRLGGLEATLTFPLLTAQLLSSRGEADLCELCPDLPRERVVGLLQIAATTLLRSARLVYVSTCMAEAQGLQSQLLDLRSDAPLLGEEDVSGVSLQLLVKASTLASKLAVTRHTVAEAGEGWEYEPRLVVFEFTASVLLRKEQASSRRGFA